GATVVDLMIIGVKSNAVPMALDTCPYFVEQNTDDVVAGADVRIALGGEHSVEAVGRRVIGNANEVGIDIHMTKPALDVVTHVDGLFVWDEFPTFFRAYDASAEILCIDDPPIAGPLRTGEP